MESAIAAEVGQLITGQSVFILKMYFILQEDVFPLKAIELGKLRKVKIRHDNKGGGAAWYLGHVIVEDPKHGNK